MGENEDQNSSFAGTGEVNERSNPVDRPPPIVEAPVSSPRWAGFFTVAALAGIALGIWTSFIAPHLLIKRTQEACRYEQKYRISELPLVFPGNRDPCMLALELESRNKLSDRVYAFLRFLLLPLSGFYLAGRLRARSALAALQADPRTPVLYLRSFQADQLDEALRSSERPWTEETNMVVNLEHIGPVLAIGRPGEKLSHLGAARLYVSDLEWQNVVRQLMEAARLVVIRVGLNTPGIQWELSCARELPGEKIVLWFPQKLKGVGYSTFRENVRERLKVELPESCPKGFVTFNANWEPKLLGPEMATREPAPALPVGEVQEFVSSAAYRQRKPSGAEVASPQTSPPESPGGEPREQAEHSSSMESIPPAVPPKLFELLERLQANMKAPPPFRLHAVVWLAVALWLFLLWGVPGERWAFALDRLFENYQHFVGTLVEGATTMLVALGLAFIPYIRYPVRRLVPSLILCAVLALDSYWIVARATPNEVKQATVEKSAFDVAFSSYSARVAENSEIRNALRDAKTPQAVIGLGMELSTKGLQRLSDDQLIRRSILIGRIIEISDVPTCAEFWTGWPRKGIEHELRQLTADEIQEWFDLQFEAMLAALQQRPSPGSVTQQRVVEAWETLLGVLSAADASLLISALDQSKEPTTEDACKAARLVSANLPHLPAADRAVLARSLVSP